jgi:integrase
VIPLLGRRAVKEVTPANVRAFIRDIIAGKTAANVKTGKRGRAIVEGGPGAAARTAGLLGGIFTYAVHSGYRPDNPVTGVERPADNRRRIHLNPDQYKALGDALSDATGREPWQAVEAARLLALTGARLGEVVNLKRTECDVRNSYLRLGDTKTGESIRPLGRAALAVIRAALGRHTGAYVFPALRRSHGPYGGIPKAWARLVGKRPELAGLTPHGLRHAFSNIGDDLGFTEATIGAVIGHGGSGSTTAGYISKPDAALLAAADRIAARIDDMMEGRAVATGEVIELAAARA